jgi:steroid 5-alpha reductase family enzyme
LIVAAAYVVAFVAACATFYYARPSFTLLWSLALADIVATIVIYGFGVLFRNSSFYDAYWSVAPPVIVLFWFWTAGGDGNVVLQTLVTTAVLLWAIRLTANWARGWTGIQHQDWRYTMLKKDGGFKAFAADFFGIHLFPTFMVFMACLPLWPAITTPVRDINLLAMIAFAVCVAGTVISLVADEQLRIFKQLNTDPQVFMQSGIWSWSRHPNYFGEWLFWVGVFLFGCAAGPDYWWTGIGAVLMLVMFLFASVPMMEKRMFEKRAGYAEYRQRVSVFFLWPF